MGWSRLFKGRIIREQSIFALKTNHWRVLLTIALFSSGFFIPERTIAQITPDNTLGEESSVVVPNQEIRGIDSD